MTIIQYYRCPVCKGEPHYNGVLGCPMYEQGADYSNYKLEVDEVLTALMTAPSFERLGRFIMQQAPKRATGIYIIGRAVRYGFRTNKRKSPANYIWFDSLLGEM